MHNLVAKSDRNLSEAKIGSHKHKPLSKIALLV